MYNFLKFPNYHVCESLNDVCAMFAELPTKEMVALDTETSGLSAYTDHIVGYSFGVGNIGYYVPIRHFHNPIKDTQLTDTKEVIKDWLENTAEAPKLFWNAKFDLKMLKREGITLSGPIHDGMVLLSLVHKPLVNSKLKLKSAAKEVLGYEPNGLTILNAEKSGKGALIEKLGYGIISYSVLGLYAAEDAFFTYQLCDYLLKKLDDKEPEVTVKTKERCSLL